jgi:hypothetical protein
MTASMLSLPVVLTCYHVRVCPQAAGFDVCVEPEAVMSPASGYDVKGEVLCVCVCV